MSLARIRIPPTGASQAQALAIQLQEVGEGVVVTLSGVMDHSVDQKLVVPPRKRTRIFDLSDVSRVSSSGVSSWLTVMGRLPLDGYSCFVGCGPALMSQFNAIQYFAGRGELVSFYAPHFCLHCECYFEVQVDLRRQHRTSTAEYETREPCPRCQAPAELDDLPEAYFHRVSTLPAPRPPADADAILAGLIGQE